MLFIKVSAILNTIKEDELLNSALYIFMRYADMKTISANIGADLAIILLWIKHR